MTAFVFWLRKNEMPFRGEVSLDTEQHGQRGEEAPNRGTGMEVESPLRSMLSAWQISVSNGAFQCCVVNDVPSMFQHYPGALLASTGLNPEIAHLLSFRLLSFVHRGGFLRGFHHSFEIALVR